MILLSYRCENHVGVVSHGLALEMSVLSFLNKVKHYRTESYIILWSQDISNTELHLYKEVFDELLNA